METLKYIGRENDGAGFDTIKLIAIIFYLVHVNGIMMSYGNSKVVHLEDCKEFAFT